MTSPLGTRGSRATGLAYEGLRGVNDGTNYAQIETILRSKPACYDAVLEMIHPLMSTDALDAAALVVRRAGESEAWYSVPFPDHLSWMWSNGFTREDARQIRYLVEVFHSEEPLHALIAAIVLRAQNDPQSCPETDFVPFSNDHAFHRVLSDWPEYRLKISGDISGSVFSGEYGRAIRAVRSRVIDRAEVLAADLPSFEIAVELVCPIAKCLDVSCEVVVLAGALRRMFIRAETVARRTFW